MKNVCWALFGLSALLMLVGSYSKLSGQDVMDFDPIVWWRGAMAAVIYSIALALIPRVDRA